jgi:tetratricopeptide (TPR) repeat protein
VTIETIAAAPTVDTARPWPGLDAFTEALSPFFFGRNAEADDLFRLVRRDLVTLLFGQSGLGKTSLLQAGLFPRLRQAGFQPILVRLDYSAGAPPLAAQVKAAIGQEFSGAAVAGEIPLGEEDWLWGCFHRVGRRFADRTGKEVVPVLVFDQFEEIFTQGLSGAESRAASQSFLTELAELVENRPPEALEQAIEADPEIVDNFSFDRRDYRIVLAMREDFLASLEGLRSRAPSIGRNRYRLRRMTGREGLDAILNPAPGLVAPEVGEEIIRFIGRASPEDVFGIAGRGGAAEGFEVEPSLLSLVCRELNERRLARGLDQIGADLLAGSRDDIIEGFYERVLADQPPALRGFVEDELLSDSGFRESVTLDSAHRVLNDDGVPVAALDELVARRLLRVEERLGITRVEIIHDVLTPVIRRSRDTRRLRQAEAAAAEREAALRRERQRVRRAHWFAATMALLAVITVALAWWGWSSKVEAERQRAFADEQRAFAEQQRNFAEEQRITAAAESKRAEQNFDMAVTTADTMVTTVAERLRNLTGVSTAAIKEILGSAEGAFDQITAVSPNSAHLRWRRAIMLISFTDTYRTLGETSEAFARAQTARTLMLALINENPDNTDWLETLSESHEWVGEVFVDQGKLAAALTEYRACLEIDQRLADKDPGNAAWQRNLAISHEKIGNVLGDQGGLATALAEYRTALDIYRRMAEKDTGNAQSQRDLAIGHDNVGEVLRAQGDLVAALAEHRAALDIFQRLAAKDPGNAELQRDLSVSHNNVGKVLRDQDNPTAALVEYRAALGIRQRLAEKDPDNAEWQHDLAASHGFVGELLFNQADLTAALIEDRAALTIEQRLAEQDLGNVGWQRDLAVSHDNVGDVLRAQGNLGAALAEHRVAVDIFRRLAEKDPGNAQWQRDLLLSYEKMGLVNFRMNDFATALGAFENSEKVALHVKEINPTAKLSASDLARIEARLEETRRKLAGPSAAGNRRR